MRAGLLALAFVVAAGCAPRSRAPDGPSVIPVGKARGGGPAARACEQGLSTALDPEHAEGTRIVEVCMTGASPEARAAVSKVLQLHVDSTLTVEALRRDLEAAYATGLLDQIEARAHESGTGTLLLLSLQDRRRITAVTFDGLIALAKDPILGELPKVGAPLSPGAVHAGAEKLKGEYVAQGWDEANVSFAIAPDSSGARVKFTVVEGTRARVGKVTFNGAMGGREVGLRKAIELEAGAPLRDDQLMRGALLANAFYYDSGFLNVRIEEPKRARAKDGTTAITFEINEGPIFHIGKLHVSKVDAATEKQILAAMQVKAGDVFGRSRLITDIKDITERYRQQGNPVTVEPETALDAKTGIVDLTLAVTPAP